MGVGCALVGNVFLVIALFYWLSTGNAPFAFGIIAIGVLLQYYYNNWSKWIWKLLKY